LNIGRAYQASPIWRGIEKAREVLKKRACYAVGNGHKVRVWEDLWIPWLENFKPRPKNNLVEQQSLVVSQLIDGERGCWDLAKLKELFDEESCYAILAIPLSLRNIQDKMMWVANPHGMFTVKLAYFLQQVVLSSPERSVWRRLWRLRMYERYKMKLWRIAHNILPTRSRLKELGLTQEGECPFCHIEEESCLHLFKDCDLAKTLWFGNRWNVSSSFQLVQLVVDPSSNLVPIKIPIDQFQTMAVIIWEQIWNLRNKIIFKKSEANMQVALLSIERKFHERSTIWIKQDTNKTPMQTMNWKAPTFGSLKINCDVVVVEKEVCVAAVVRDWGGNIIAVGTRMESKGTINQAEAKGIKWAILMAKLLGLRKMEVEGDSKICFEVLIKAKNGELPQATLWKTRPILEDTPATSYRARRS
jgi:hypothetical protein